MKPIRTFTVVPALPPALEPLREIAMNLRWAWDHDSIDLFARLDPELWIETKHNPVELLARLEQERLEEAAGDPDLVAHVERVKASLDEYLATDETWFRREHAGEDASFAYFSAEFGVTGCLSIFAGGLGMLAGDHLKSASDLDIPLVGVGLLYQQGYFVQRLNEAGWQQEIPASNDFDMLPLTLERGPNGEPITVELGFPDGVVVAQVWRAQVGRVPLYLLDANVSANSTEQRLITEQLYGGGEEMRIRQEILLGIGGYRALEALGIHPDGFHMNEGHSAFLALERIRRLMEDSDVDFDAAAEAASAGLVFTTHTPVEAGHDYFTEDLLSRYFNVYVKSLGIDWERFVGLGRQRPQDKAELFCMTILALRLASRSNGVSRLHGEVSRAMWQGIWPGMPEDEIPIGHVTNGVHLASWLSAATEEILRRHGDDQWRGEPTDPGTWDHVEEIPDEELWAAHGNRRGRLIEMVRRRLREQAMRRGATPAEIEAASSALDPDALTIGFARRFATYKRATLFARDRERLARLLGDPERPVQLIIAGKAHPRDDAGKELIRQIAELSQTEPFVGKIVFVEDYGMSLARYLVSGSDVWLNNPVRPREASGTSGMKAAANGVLNLSTLDGWWDEAWNDFADGAAPFGWAIGHVEFDVDGERRDKLDAASLYDLLEHDVVPAFYDRGDDGVPRSWTSRMKSSISRLGPEFNTHRMLHDYTRDYYLPAADGARAVLASDMRLARDLASWRSRVGEHWSSVACRVVEAEPDMTEVRVGDELLARAEVELGGLEPADVAVELYVGPVGPDGTIHSGRATPMEMVDRQGEVYIYEASSVRPRRSGRFGFTVRVRAYRDDLPQGQVPGRIVWATVDESA